MKQEIQKLKNRLAKLEAKLEKENWIKFVFQGKDYEVSGDLGEMTWDNAVKECEELGGQLPPRWLLCAIFDEKELKHVKDAFGSSSSFWSATETSETSARYVNFSTGAAYYNNKADVDSVRCVRGL